MMEAATMTAPLARAASTTSAVFMTGTRGAAAVEVQAGDDRLLIRQAQAGDVRAFEALYRRNVGRVYALCLRMCGEPGYAEEMTQESFIRAWERLASFRGDAQLSTWLHRVTVNVVLSDRRSRTHRMEKVTDSLEQQEFSLSSRPDFPGLNVDLDEAIRRLPEGAREVFVLHDVQGYKHREIAEMTGMAPGTSKAHLHRARRLLREYLNT
jgi:RNA polymerase sigma-70 factor (ECF subfamily)